MASTTTSSTSIPSYIETPTKDALKGITDWTKSADNYVYGSKPGESLYTPLSAGQNKAIGNVNWMADQDLAELFGINKAGGMLDDVANYNPANIDTTKLTDESGWLGSIAGDMNPYLEQILQPQIRELNKQAQIGRRDLADGATMSGAFGDARHGLLEGDIYDTTARNVADVTGQAYKDAFDSAMAMRAGDRSAKFGVDTANQNAGFQQQANKITAASGVAGLGRQYQDQWSAVNDALFNSGQVQRDATEEQRLAIQGFQEAMKNKKYDDAMRILGAINGSPYSTSSTSKESSNDGLWGLIGSGISALFG